MDNILDHVVVQGQRYDIVSPTAFGDNIETIGSACINPDGYAQGSTFLAKLGNEQFYYEATAAITQGSSILEGTNCKKTTVTGREAELASEIETLGDNVTSLSEALSDQVDAYYLKNKNLWAWGDEFGTLMDGKQVDIPAGNYVFSANVSSSDTNANTCLMIFVYDNDSNVQTTITRGVNQLASITLTSHVKQVVFYASDNYSHSVGGTFAFTNIMLSTEGGAYVPYVPSNLELLSYKDNGVLGAKNLLPNNAVTQVLDGIQFTVNSDGSVTLNTVGTRTTFVTLTLSTPNLPSNHYIVTGCPSGGGNDTYYLNFKVNGSWSGNQEYGSGKEVIGIINEVGISVPSTSSPSNVTFKPMIRLASDTDPTYQPYAMTNKELTDVVSKNNISSNIVALTTSMSSPFTSDGYVIISATAADSYIRVRVYGADEDSNAPITCAYQGSNAFNSIFVRKGMKALIEAQTGTTNAVFRALY